MEERLIPVLRFKDENEDTSRDWNISKLGDLCIKIQDGNYGALYPKSEEFMSEGIPFLTSKVLNDDGKILSSKIDYITSEKHKEIKKAHLSLNDIIFTNRGAKVGQIGFIDDSLAHGNIGPQLTLLRSNQEKIFPLFLRQSMLTERFKKQIYSQDSGSAMNFFGIKDTKKFRISLPSLPEQQKIADFLSSVDKKIEQLTRKKELLEKYKIGMMQKLFPKAGEQHPELRFKDENGQDYPDWDVIKLNDLLEITTAPSKSKFIDENGIYFVLDMGGIDSRGKLTHHKKTNKYKDIIQHDMLVMPKDDIGGGNIIGKVGLIKIKNKYVLGDHVYGLSIKGNDIIQYLYFVINSQSINKSFRIKATGTSQLGLNKKNVENQLIPMPSKPEQQKIADFLSAIDDKITKVEGKFTKALTFKKGLLQQMFV